MSNWLDKLSENDLKSELDTSIRQILEGVDKAGGNIDHIGAALAYPLQHLGSDENRRLATGFWSKIRREMYILICKSGSKYSDLRKQLSRGAITAHDVLVTAIAAAISEELGFGPALLTPFIVLCLIAVVRIGKEAWCCSFDKVPGNCNLPCSLKVKDN
jgi:hypothetical protein